MKTKAPIVKQLFRLSVERRVVDQLSKLSERLQEPKSRLANRLFAEAVMGAITSLQAGRSSGRRK